MSYAGAIASLVGGEMQGWAAKEAQRQMFGEFEDELIRQGRYEKQGAAAMDAAIRGQGYDAAQASMAAGVKDRTGRYSQNVPLDFEAPNKATTAVDKAAGDQVAAARAKLGSYSDWSLNQAINQIRTQQQLNQITNFAGGTASVFPYREYRAQHSWDTLAAMGQEISSLGGGSTNYGQLLGGSPNVPPGGVGPGGGYGAGVYYPYGSSYAGYDAFPSSTTPYGQLPYGWNTAPSGTFGG